MIRMHTFIYVSMITYFLLLLSLVYADSSSNNLLDIDVIDSFVNKNDDLHFIYGDYSFESHIRPGHYGRLWRGRQLSTGKEVAFKMNTDGERLERTQRETDIMLIIQGAPNTVPYFQTLEGINTQNETTSVIAMGYFRGDELINQIDKMNASTVKYVIYQMLRTVNFTNKRGIYHLDINPGNVLINITTLDLVILDWGESKVLPNGLEGRSEIQHSDVNELGEYLLVMSLGSVGIPHEVAYNISKEYFNRDERRSRDDLFASFSSLSSVDPQVWDLVDKMLRRNNYLSADEVIQHPYFDELHGRVKVNVAGKVTYILVLIITLSFFTYILSKRLRKLRTSYNKLDESVKKVVITLQEDVEQV